jgi:hypothetical protein
VRDRDPRQQFPRSVTGRGAHQVSDGKLPLWPIVIALWKLRDVVAGIAKRDQLAATGQRDWPVKFAVPIV